MNFLLKIFFITILLYILVKRKQQIILFNYNKNDDFKYICNTFINIYKPNNINKFINDIRLRIENLNILNIKAGLFNIVNTDEELNEILFSRLNKQILWRLIFLNNNDRNLIVFQNHRSLCGGQERIWYIINNLLDTPVKYQECKIKKYSLTNLNYIINSNPFVNTISLLTHKSTHLCQNQARKLIIKNFSKNNFKMQCKKFNCSVNDYSLAFIIFFFIKKSKILDETINIFIPLYIDGEYSYYILIIPGNINNFRQLVEYIRNITINTIRNQYIKKLSLISTKLASLLPKILYYKIYKNTMNKIHIFISNVPGFKTERTIFGIPIENIYHSYNSYNRIIEAGISSYNNKITLTLNCNTEYLKEI